MYKVVFELEYSTVCEALNIIKTLCEEHESCSECPIYGDNGCKLYELDTIPCDWKIKYSGDAKC